MMWLMMNDVFNYGHLLTFLNQKNCYMVTNPYLGSAHKGVFEPKTIQKIVNLSTKPFQLKKQTKKASPITTFTQLQVFGVFT